ncbi:MAG: hypothetical protein ACTHMC_20090 [Pseudobacter sp.]|uniref:hypothetical protein n=1 Tax=Pseudobacter sp. TaxID=2045420 RepID=UPI003F815466
MNQEELERYIRKKIRSGYPAGELENELLQKGIPPEQIRSVMDRPANSWSSSSFRKEVIIMETVSALLFLGLKVFSDIDTETLIIGFLCMALILPMISRGLTSRKQ